MRYLMEEFGQLITELVGFFGVMTGIFGVIYLIRTFGDNFIAYFI